MYSQNGYFIGRSLIASYAVPGAGGIRVALRKGDVSVVLLWLLEQYNAKVEPLRQSDLGGYAERVVRGGVSMSNHSSGTAVDTRWRDHPLGAKGTFSSHERAEIRNILDTLGGCVRWGGDYSGRKDEMHFEIVGSPAKVAKYATRIRNGTINAGHATTNLTTFTRTETEEFQRNLNRIFPKYKSTPLTTDGTPGPKTIEALKEFQRHVGLTDDGIAGPKTRAQLKKYNVL